MTISGRGVCGSPMAAITLTGNLRLAVNTRACRMAAAPKVRCLKSLEFNGHSLGASPTSL
jgi:hypothetical protein